MVIKPDILYLEINGRTVEAEKVSDAASIERKVTALKDAYRLKPKQDYVFFLKRESKMN